MRKLTKTQTSAESKQLLRSPYLVHKVASCSNLCRRPDCWAARSHSAWCSPECSADVPARDHRFRGYCAEIQLHRNNDKWPNDLDPLEQGLPSQGCPSREWHQLGGSWEAAGTTQSPSAGGRDPCPEPKGSHTALCAQTGDKGARGTEIQRWGLREDHPWRSFWDHKRKLLKRRKHFWSFKSKPALTLPSRSLAHWRPRGRWLPASRTQREELCSGPERVGFTVSRHVTSEQGATLLRQRMRNTNNSSVLISHLKDKKCGL